MENRSTEEEHIKYKKPLTAAERKAKQRDKQKAIKNGTYQIPLIEQAKQDIQNLKDFSIDTLLMQEKYHAKFDIEQMKQLKTFIQNQKQKIKKEQEEYYSKEQQVINIKEKAKRLGNQQIPQLHQALLNPQTYQERIELIKIKIQENLYLFLEYMESYQSPSQDFMKIIVDLYNDFDDDTSTKLFARVCSRHRGEILLINSNMVQKTMNFLLDKKIDNIAAFGLLRLVYQNNISFFEFPIQLLIDFQSQYEQTILNFLKSISPLKFQVVESLPPTCFCFTSPILKTFKEEGDILHTQVPYHFLPYVIEIICYSFNNDEEKFQQFLKVFKDGCKKLYEILLTCDFCNLLQAISDKTKAMNSLFFRKIDHSSHILEKAFYLIQEKKIGLFDNETVSMFIDSNQEQIQILNLRPKIIKKGTKSLIQQIFNVCQQNNSTEMLQNINLEDPIIQEDMNIFQSMGISNLLPIQEICFRYCISLEKMKRVFIQYDIGQGKTSLCLAVAAVNVRNGHTVYIVNCSQDLAFRDFKKAFKIKNKLQMEILWLSDGSKKELEQNCIIFCTISQYIDCYKNFSNRQQQAHLCIFDEFDSSIFELSQHLKDSINILQKHDNIIGFTGSELQPFHISYLKQHMKARYINFSQNHSDKLKTQCDFIQVHNNSKLFKNSIVEKCLKQFFKSPIIIIMKEGYQGIAVEILANGDFSIIEAAMNVFTEKQRNGYQIYIINENQGRGLDFLSTSEIEKNGGIYLIIACLPNNFLQFNQFLGRTGRIGNNGQFAIILQDKLAQNIDGQIYLNKKLSELQNKDILFIQNLQSLESIVNIDSEINSCKEINFFECQNQLVKEEHSSNVLLLNNLENKNDIKEFENNENCEQTYSQNFQEETKECNQNGKYIQAQSQDLSKKRIQKLNNKEQLRQSKRIEDYNSNKLEIDKAYYESYSDPKIHEEMLNDKIRMQKYQDAIEKISKNCKIIDIGTGTGVLSMMAANAGAKHIFAIEYSDIINTAIQTIKDNNLQDKITFIKSKAEEADLPNKPFDLIISEWMGYSLLYENMLPSVLLIRDKYLKEGGSIIPKRTQLIIAAIYKEINQNGFNFSSINKRKIDQAKVEIVQEKQLMTNSCVVIDIDLEICLNSYKNFKTDFKLVALQEGMINGFVLWFNAFLTDDIILSTSPQSPQTHWKQTILMLDKDFSIKMGDIVEGEFSLKFQKNNYRALDYKISFQVPSLKNKKIEEEFKKGHIPQLLLT